MKRIYGVLIIVGGLMVLILALYFIYNTWNHVGEDDYKTSNCDYWNLENCNYSCNVDVDCHQSACKCVNINEEILTEVTLPNGEDVGVVASCALLDCICVNSTCEGRTI